MSPIASSFAGISVLPLGFTRGVIPTVYFIARIQGNASQTFATSCTAVGNRTFLAVSDFFYTPFRYTQVRLNEDLTLANNLGDTNSTGSGQINSIAAEATNASYVTNYPKNSNSWLSVSRTNANGTLAWERTYTGVGQKPGVVQIGESGNVYATTSTGEGASSQGTTRCAIIKYNSSGTIQWQRSLTDPAGYAACGSHGMAVSSTGNVYKAWSMASAAGSSWPYLTKLNSSGTAQWTMRGSIGLAWLHPSSNTKIDSAENVYHSASDGSGVILTKFDTNGVVQFRRRYTLSGVSIDGHLLETDSSGNSYILFYKNSLVYVIKYNSSGTIQWQRSMARSGGSLGIRNAGDAEFYADNNSIMFGADDTHAFFFRMPADGSKTGSYVFNGVTYTWATVSGTDAADTTTWTSITVNAGTPAGTDSSGSQSFASATYTIASRTI